MIKLSPLPCLFPLLLCCVAGDSAADKLLTVNAMESTAHLQPRDAKQRQILLPALEIAIVVSLECPADAKAMSLTVSVSDTRQYFGPQLLADAESIEAAFSVPAKQLTPVSVPGFCVSGEPIDDQGIVLPGIATVQVSLRCGGEDDPTSVYFTSAPLPVRLYCRADGVPDTSSMER